MEQPKELSDQLAEFQAAYSKYVSALRKIQTAPHGSPNCGRWISLAITNAETSGNYALDAIFGASRLDG
jgi:hypothetical protein